MRRPLRRVYSRLRAGAAVPFSKGDVGSVFPLPTPGRKLVTFIQISYYSFIYSSRQGIYVNGKIIFQLLIYVFFLNFTLLLPYVGAVISHLSPLQGSLIPLFSGFSPGNLKN